MTIVFICGALEPGRDGVGDYTRLLSAELVKHGISVNVIAINDAFVSEEYSGEQLVNGTMVNVLRLPAKWSHNKRYSRAASLIININPQWVSLQYVPFAFQPKGFPIGLSRLLTEVRTGRKLHIMFHELWVGMDTNAGTKLVWWGRLQQMMIKKLLTTLQPDKIHTQTKLYQSHITRMNFVVGHLQLFSNIPVTNNQDKAFADVYDTGEDQFVLFGTIHPGVPVKDFIHEVATYYQLRQRSPELIFIGRNGAEQKLWSETWQSYGINIKILGEQTEQFISAILHKATIGISTTPLALAEKSGTIAAMREHGLPVICVSKYWRDRTEVTFSPEEQICNYTIGNLGEILSNYKKKDAAPALKKVALQFSKILSE